MSDQSCHTDFLMEQTSLNVEQNFVNIEQNWMNPEWTSTVIQNEALLSTLFSDNVIIMYVRAVVSAVVDPYTRVHYTRVNDEYMYLFTLQLTPSTDTEWRSGYFYFYHYVTTVIWLNILSLYLVCPGLHNQKVQSDK